MGSALLGEGVRGRGAGLIMARAGGLLFTIPAFLRMISSWGCLITRKNAGIMPLALYESQMGGLNHTYFTHDGALGRLHAAVGSFRSLFFTCDGLLGVLNHM